ncbi:LppU/SCO3897 family protein [Streptomyces sp. GS7]|uniref:LppU/SCO3897 family protein n=1 Tax=Streptomyces sp. GS7 TaxID=2692234 RepID=UPI003FA71665
MGDLLSAHAPPPSGPQSYGQSGPGPYGPPHHGSYGQPGQGPYGPPAPVPHGAPHYPMQQANGQVLSQQGGFVSTPGVPPSGGRPGNTTRARIIALIAVVVLVGGGWLLSRGEKGHSDKFADEAKVGDCVEKTGSGDAVVLKVVSCSSSKAAYKVAIRAPVDRRCPDGLSEYEETRRSVVTTRLCLMPAGH